ncbi:C69 family dipeptidase [Pseudodonghicola flavimaris]|uniref:Dipeptidase n=1 Tax=Pseudodonghicola flavimaris TaxID=3050036 RepID=A0ABT7EW38_9RHOB|nr:C69 family dipeptidase [Pseudodonghicola flavimaris]MDK3016570.1 C69 family dipeptidase [Pseudodonghicola flavimaris]
MCDTMIALGSITASGRVLLAKNSDREPNEAQYLTRTAAADHPPGSRVRMTYVDIPQVPHTYAHVGSRPWWMWGFEHGVNEHGLAIGNEAEWSRLPAGQAPGLLGMDLLRLTLERARDADEGLEVLTGLIETYGQSGRASTHRDMFYQNAFILADPTRAWVLETAGPHWVAKRVRDWASISNVYSIGTEFDRISADAIAFAEAQGWHRPGTAFDWAAAYTDPDLPFLPSCRARLAMSQAGMGALAQGPVSLDQMVAQLRDHGDVAADWRPGLDGSGMVCMHATAADRSSETVASMVAELGADRGPVIWSSLCSPCLSSFVPVWIDAALPPGWSQPAEDAPDAWWRMQRLQRLVERDYAGTARYLRAALDRIEADAFSAARALPATADAACRAALTERLAAEQAGAIAALEAIVPALQAGLLPPRGDDPRGAYLQQVAASAPDTRAPATTPATPPAAAG